MSDHLNTLTKQITEGAVLPPEQMSAGFDQMMAGEASPIQIAAFLIALKMRGEVPSDIAAGAASLRRHALTLTAPEDAMDIVGTGGDGIGTYNISTATALVLAGAGIPVAKHGNRAVSSKSGAADVLTALGINLDCPFDALSQTLNTAKIAFLMAPRHHSAMRHVGPVRAELGVRTIFNLLGPLSNPALVKRILVGVFDARWLTPFAEALSTLGTTHAWVVHGADGLDELSTTGTNHIAILKHGQMSEAQLHPSDLGLPVASLDDIKGGSAEENATALRALLDGATGPYRDIVLLNAAAGFVAGGHETELSVGLERATQAIDSGAAKSALEQLISITNS